MSDLDAIRKKWLKICGACDAGIGLCNHPFDDYRPVMLSLVEDVERLTRRQDEHLTRANEAARLSAEARDAADDLRTKIADQAETIADLERQRMDRDAWAVRVCTENNLYELPLNVEDEFAAIAAAFRAFRTDLASSSQFADIAVRGREEALREVERLLRERDRGVELLHICHGCHERIAAADLRVVAMKDATEYWHDRCVNS